MGTPGRKYDEKPIREAARRTLERSTARVSARLGHGSAPGGSDVMTAEGVADLYGRRVYMRESPLLSSVQATNRSSRGLHGFANAVARRVLLRGLDKPAETIYEGALVLTRPVGASTWENYSGGQRSGAPNVNDPLWVIDAVLGTVKASTVASERVRHVECRRFELVVDLVAADAATPAGISVPAGLTVRQLRQLPAHVWLDADGLVRKISVSVGAADDAKQPLWATTELFDFNADIQVPRPSASEVRLAYAASRA